MTITAGMITVMILHALPAVINLATHNRCPAIDNIVDNPAMLQRDRTTELRKVRVAEISKNFGYLRQLLQAAHQIID
jgi:hypothetical protein